MQSFMAKWGMSRASTPAPYALILIDMVRRMGHPLPAILADTSLAVSGVHGVGARVSQGDFLQLVVNAQSLTRDPALGLHLGERLNLSAHAILGQAFMTCRDLHEVLDLFMKYYHLLSPELELSLELSDTEYHLTTIAAPDPALEVFGSELMAAALLNTLRGLLSRNDFRLRVEFPYAEPRHAHDYHALFGSENVRFHCSHQRICFDRRLGDTPLPSSNPALRELYEDECARLLSDLEATDSMAEQVLSLLRKLEGQYPQMPQVAGMLNISPRTLRRRLDAENAAFQPLLDSVRAEHATRYLKNTRLPLASIAYMIGFSDPSNFRRAYRKWTGHTPAEVRRGG
ncbi:MAG: AraC family transcriptional regulator ligand-binding domain-containing protein [Chromatocurvus sp.]